ncbi:type II toxin-antitoxin system RelE/ParE family toxin [Orrella sp. 11846]|uniref:type II toxin-antitoxin system RelE/ParE family toxin n=1 Tax=Orrella sp. 11846 TaxID=3409913 RepID=UPI003B59B4FC
MRYGVKQTRRFARVHKKLHNNTAINVDIAVEAVALNPMIGERKKGDLAQLYVYKLRSQGQLYLLGYTIDEGIRLVYLEALGVHENFYRDLND